MPHEQKVEGSGSIIISTGQAESKKKIVKSAQHDNTHEGRKRRSSALQHTTQKDVCLIRRKITDIDTLQRRNSSTTDCSPEKDHRGAMSQSPLCESLRTSLQQLQ